MNYAKSSENLWLTNVVVVMTSTVKRTATNQ